MLIRKLYAATLRITRSAVSGAVLPLTQNSVAKTQRSVWGATKNLVTSAMGKGAPLYDRAAGIRNLSWDRMRGTLVNPNYGHDGRLVLSLRDGVITEESLQMLEALDNSEIGALDPSSKGLQGGIANIGLELTNRSAKKQCGKLLELRKLLEADAGNLEVERSPDGFSRMLKISIDTSNKSVENIQREIENVFAALGIGSPDLAKSLAKELVHERDTGMRQSNLVSQTSTARGENAATNSYAPAAGAGQERSPEHGRSQSTVDHNASTREEASPQHNVAVDGAVMEDCVAESFSMSRGAGPGTPAGSSVDHIARQTQFLEESDRCTGGSAPNRSGISIDIEALRDAASGLGDMSHDQSMCNTRGEAPYATPAGQRSPSQGAQGTSV